RQRGPQAGCGDRRNADRVRRAIRRARRRPRATTDSRSRRARSRPPPPASAPPASPRGGKPNRRSSNPMLTQLTFENNVSGVNIIIVDIRRTTMNVVVVAVTTLLTLAAGPVLAVGFEQVTVPDPDGPPLEAGIW